jgi:histidyl-tRNA synthetase
MDHADEMCADCLERAELNPLRAFDCKNAHCREVMRDAPLVPQNLCDECATHYEQVKRYLDQAGVAYEEDPTLVRGLDYYTRTVFEVEVEGAGVGAIGGGGRYDGLMELEGGKPTPGLGFAIGFERIILALQAQGVNLGEGQPTCVYVACTPDQREKVFAAVMALRTAGVRCESDCQGRSLKSQFKQADKLGARLCVVLGPDEVAAGVATLRDMETHEQEQVPLDDLVVSVTRRLA